MNYPTTLQDSPPSPANCDHPSKLFVELTTRCNLQCRMCVKQTPGCRILEGDLAMAHYQRLIPAMPRLQTLVLNGIGEPLLHPYLEQFVQIARHHMPASANIGFQTNAMLLTREMAQGLVLNGLDRICISLDTLSPKLLKTVRQGADLETIDQTLADLVTVRRSHPSHRFEIGLEIVLRRDNLNELPQVVKWAAEMGVDFLIATHLMAYEADGLPLKAFDNNTDAAIHHFEKWEALGAQQGIEMSQYYPSLWQHTRTDSQQRIVDHVDALMAEAIQNNLFVNLKAIMSRDQQLETELRETFQEAQAIARTLGIDLHLPAIRPQAQKRCEFAENGSVFVSWQGEVHPCFFLWHSYRCHISGWEKHVTARSFGSLADATLLDIWNQNDFRIFRRTVLNYDYPLCSNCNLAPCDYIYLEDFEQDCHTNTIPCCDCQWCLGIFKCLQ